MLHSFFTFILNVHLIYGICVWGWCSFKVLHIEWARELWNGPSRFAPTKGHSNDALQQQTWPSTTCCFMRISALPAENTVDKKYEKMRFRNLHELMNCEYVSTIIKILIFADPVIPGCWQYSPRISMPSAMSTHLSNLSMYKCASPLELRWTISWLSGWWYVKIRSNPASLKYHSSIKNDWLW